MLKRGRDLQKWESCQRRHWSGCYQSALGNIFWQTFCQLGTGEALRLQIIGVTCIKADEGSKHSSRSQITEARTGANVHPDWERPGEGDKREKRSVESWMIYIYNLLGVYFCLLSFACDNTQLMKMTYHYLAFKGGKHLTLSDQIPSQLQQNYEAAQLFSTLFIVRIVLRRKSVY